MQHLPLPWLSQLLSTIREQKSKNSLFETCTLLRDLTLAQADRVQCLLDISRVNPTKAARSLQLLKHCREDVEAQLVLQDPEANYGGIEKQAAQLTSWLTTLCSNLSSTLPSITHVDLKSGHVLGDIVPADLQALCPNMTHLTRQGWFPDLPHHASGHVRPCQQLQHLTILGFHDDQPVEALQQQFNALPNLQSLHFVHLGKRQAQDHFLRGIQPLHTHLQSLTVQHGDVVLDVMLADSWPRLKTLRFPDAVWSEDQLDLVLRQAPQVTELEVGIFRLRESFAKRQCKWQHLTVDHLYCDSLVNLPVGAIHTLHFRVISLQEPAWPHLHAAAAILAKIPDIKTVQDALILFLGGDTEPQVADIVALLQHLPQGHIKVESIASVLSPLWLQVLGQLQYHTLTVHAGQLPNDCWGTLLQQLSQVNVLHVYKKRSVNACIHRLSTFCKAADRPCTLQIEQSLARALGPGWQDHLNTSMQAAGHQHVHIEVVVVSMGKVHRLE